MEKRKAIGLRGYFTRTLLLFFVGVLGIFVLSFLVLLLGLETGAIAPANAGERAARAEIARQSEAGAFTGDLQPAFYEYVYFDRDGNVTASSLTDSALSWEISLHTPDNATHGTGTYVFYPDGSRCLFTWRYVAAFTNPTLRRLLPGPERMMLLVAGIASVLFFLLYVRGMGHRLGNKLALVEAASEQIALQNLDTPIATAAGIREFNHALQSMDDMRSTLKAALIRQWESEQQRRQEIAALAHDLKTPLTVIGGNAELLLEDALTEDQARLAAAIHSAGARAQQYVSALQQVSMLDMDGEAAEPLAIPPLLEALHTALDPLAAEQSITLAYAYAEDLRSITAFPAMLSRALTNIVENAIRFTRPGGRITISVCQTERETHFAVQDEGPGFSKPALLHAKEMFWQQDKSRTGHGNYGIGLSIADTVAKKHAGQLCLENTARGGCAKLTITG